jgi:hypothetical protein
MSYRRKIAAVACPLIRWATDSGAPDRTIARTPERRRSCKRVPVYPARRQAERQALLNSCIRRPRRSPLVSGVEVVIDPSTGQVIARAVARRVTELPAADDVIDADDGGPSA